MKKLLTMGCIFFFLFCAPRKTTVKTEGLEEVVVFGEETTNVSEEPVLPSPGEVSTAVLPTEEVAPPAAVTPPPAEEVIAPPITETAITLPPVPEVTLPPVPEVVALPPVVEEIVSAPPSVPVLPTEEVSLAAPIIPPAIPPAVKAPATPPPTLGAAPNQIYGFRVQIFASSTEKNASRVADDARTSFSGKVYIEHVAPYYKVRVGDCLTAEEAQVLKNKALNLGYKGTFVVETMISP